MPRCKPLQASCSLLTECVLSIFWSHPLQPSPHVAVSPKHKELQPELAPQRGLMFARRSLPFAFQRGLFSAGSLQGSLSLCAPSLAAASGWGRGRGLPGLRTRLGLSGTPKPPGGLSKALVSPQAGLAAVGVEGAALRPGTPGPHDPYTHFHGQSRQNILGHPNLHESWWDPHLNLCPHKSLQKLPALPQLCAAPVSSGFRPEPHEHPAGLWSSTWGPEGAWSSPQGLCGLGILICPPSPLMVLAGHTGHCVHSPLVCISECLSRLVCAHRPRWDHCPGLGRDPCCI